MERHGIRDLLRDMTEELVFTRPEQPLRLLHQKLTALLGPDGEGGGAEGGGASAGGADNGAGSGGAAPAMFALQVHVEAVGPGGSVVRHVAKRGLHAPQEVLRGWADEAAVRTALGMDGECDGQQDKVIGWFHVGASDKAASYRARRGAVEEKVTWIE